MTLLTAGQAVSAETETTAEDTINALNGVFGRHAGERTSHAKGFCAAGHFIAAEQEDGFVKGPLFKAARTNVTARFSIGGGNPKASDKSRSVRGLGLRFHISDDEELDLVMISAPVFFAATPSQFVEFLKARTADPATGQKDPAKIKAFNEANPNVMAHVNYLAETPPPASYATTPYFSTHAFLFDGTANKQRAARWIFEPAGGFQGLTKQEEESFPDSFLEADLRGRLTGTAAQWDVFLQIAEAGDAIDDPTAVWPDTRRRVAAGKLVIDQIIEKGTQNDCTGLVFDPNNLPSGIEATDDPILAIRSPAYGISLNRRSQ
ncbi:catalase family peroxidase [Anderseniella sp. Alg231-50]|uniref:catalase family peroxidase n=1 Tax=Anderseniella sp. Alg231-50 TaxID=1922226 RepID=UPI00307C4961